MSDAAHILMIMFIGVVIILVNIWRVSTKRRLTDKEKQKEENQKEKIEQLKAPHIKRKFECDVISNPAFSDFESNIFHENRPDDDD